MIYLFILLAILACAFPLILIGIIKTAGWFIIVVFIFFIVFIRGESNDNE